MHVLTVEARRVDAGVKLIEAKPSRNGLAYVFAGAPTRVPLDVARLSAFQHGNGKHLIVCHSLVALDEVAIHALGDPCIQCPLERMNKVTEQQADAARCTGLRPLL